MNSRTWETSQEIGAHLVNGELLLSERLFRGLPLLVQEHLTCLCIKRFYDDWAPYRGKNGISTTHSYCTHCKKPNRFSVRYIVQTCDECGNYYVPNPEEVFPPRWKICARCDIPAR